ncbi:hypothetical protein SEVIR_2G447100v4 [Setaria viridis]|uniref:Uncharacterized protein n=1 Tax=Setaria viridis TaxID=4556 RepID=A0A4U6W2I0_SETVI|nr:protein ENHANCED DISEASE RESISTANCE 4-like [Setaria viridis]TKW36541.1 hypothetical protein SEVIR_2G447100v2 [Setaria viridis]
MENSDARPVRRVRCPKCHSVLEEPGAPVYQCGGCGTSLRAKNRTGNTGDAPKGSPSPSRSALPPQSRHLDSTDVASTSRSSTPTSLEATSSRHRATDTTSRHESGDLVSARRHGSSDVASTSSTPTVTSSRCQGTHTRSQGESGDIVSARRHGFGDVASTSSTPTATSSSRQGIDTTSRRESGDLVFARRHGSDDVASTSSTPDATSSRRQGTDTTSRRESGDLVSARDRVSGQEAVIEKREHDQSVANQEVFDNSEGRRPRDGGVAERTATSPGVSVHFPGGNKDATSELQDDTEKRMKRQAESPDAARKKHSGEAAVQPQYHHHHEELAPKSAQAPAVQSARGVLAKEDDTVAAAAGEKALSPSRHELEAENLAPLRKKILKTVEELKGDLSELFRKSPELNPTPRARPPRLPKQEGYVSRAAVASGLPAARARRAAAAADSHRAVKHGQVSAPPPPRGLPSRRYRRCRADPCCHTVQLRPCRHGCCRHHGKPECGSCRGHCCRPRAPEPSAPRKPPPAAKEAKRRLPPRNHCRPMLKGAPFIVCSSCFTLVQVPADFAVSTKTVRKLRCGACSTVLSYSYRDPARKKAYQDSLDQFSTDGSELHGGGGCAGQPDPFAPFVDGFGLSSYSTEDDHPLHVSRNTSFDTMDGTKVVGRLHRLMGYGSASELLRHSPDLYESFSERTTPDVGRYDRKGKGVCVYDYDVDDSDEEDGGALKRSVARGSGRWPLPGILGKGTPAPGAIRIK